MTMTTHPPEIVGAKAANGLQVQLYKLLFNALLIFDILFSSRMTRIGPDASQNLVLTASVAVMLFFCALAFVNGHIKELLLFAGGVWLILNQLRQFSQVTSLPYVANLGFMFTYTLTFPVYFMASRLRLREYLIASLALYATLYAILYMMISVLYVVGALPHEILDPLALNDPERGERLFTYSAASAFAWFYWLELRTRTRLLGNAMVAICGIGILLTLSRYFIVCVALVTMLRALPISERKLGRICLIALAVAAGVYLYGLINVDWNPFMVFSGDSSGDTRIKEFDAARFQILAHPLFGIGLTADDKAVSAIVGNLFYSSGDIGVMGIWWDFGFLGIVLFFVGSYICCQPISGLRSDLERPLFLIGCMMVLYNALAPIIFYAGGSNYFCVILGLYLDRAVGRQKSGRPVSLGGNLVPSDAEHLDRVGGRTDAARMGGSSS